MNGNILGKCDQRDPMRTYFTNNNNSRYCTKGIFRKHYTQTTKSICVPKQHMHENSIRKSTTSSSKTEKETKREILHITTCVMKRKVSIFIYLYVIGEYLFRKRLTRIKQKWNENRRKAENSIIFYCFEIWLRFGRYTEN